MNKKIFVITILVTVVIAAVALAEEKKPLSPPAKAEVKMNGKSVSIDYSSPRMRDREIMGSLVPFNQVWRTGANAATTLKTEGDLMIGSLHVPAGTYTLFTIPGESEWTLIVNKQTGQWGTNYDASQDLGRVKMKVGELDAPLEEFTIELSAEGGKGELAMKWEKTIAKVQLMMH